MYTSVLIAIACIIKYSLSFSDTVGKNPVIVYIEEEGRILLSPTMDEEEQDDDDDDPMGTVHVWGNKCSNIVYFKVNSFVYS